MAVLQAKYGPSFTPFTGNVLQFVNTGEFDYDALLVQLKKRFSNNYSAQIWYTLGDSRGNTSAAGLSPTSRVAPKPKAPSPILSSVAPSCILERSWVLLPGGCCRTSTGTVARS